MQTSTVLDRQGIADIAERLVGKWMRVGLSTDQVDREAAEAAVRALYAAAGVEPPPTTFIWCQSPAAAARMIAEAGPAEPFGPSLREQLRSGPWERARAELQSLLSREGYAYAWRQTCAPIAPTASRLIEQINGAVSTATEDAGEQKRLLMALTYAEHGQHDAAWLPLFEACAEAAGLSDAPVLRALARVAEHVHWWWPFADTVILSERPVEVHVDERGRLHRGDGPALMYPDGFALHRWHNVRITQDFAETLATLTVERIRREENVELRRIMLEHYGHERYIVNSGAEPVQQDEAGRLWRVAVPGDENITMVEVVNSTAEPDGTFRTYWLRVPPDLRTARAAVAWTFGLTAEEYEPMVQT